jgi:DNA-binding LacI/PurR family transcriptional regulator
MTRRVTLKQVAAHAGVSYQTVSKVLNKQARVSKQTEERIWESVRILGYRPNLIARGLRSLRSNLVGYSWAPFPPEQSNSILDQFLQSMAGAAEHAGYHLLCFPHRDGAESIKAYQELIDTNRVDGFILSGVEFDDPRIQFLQEMNFPFVAFGRSNPSWGFPWVDVDGALGIQMATEHLLNLGHRRIFALTWPESSRLGQDRLSGYLAALRAEGISPCPEWIAKVDGVFQFGYEATAAWLAGPANQHPTAVVAFSDVMAIGAMAAARERGLQVGVDLSVTGFDDSPMIQFLTPSLTSIRQPIWEVGQKVMFMLIGILRGSPPETMQILLPPELIVRQSSCQPFNGCEEDPYMEQSGHE